MPEQFEPRMSEQPKVEGQKQEGKQEAAEEARNQRFEDRLSLLKIKPEEMSGEGIEKLKKINEKIEDADSPWVVRIMEEIKRKGGETHLLENFKPEDVDVLQKLAQEKGYDFSKEGIVSGQVKEMAASFENKKEEISQETKKTPAVEQAREKTHEEIAKHLVENPVEALAIFKKGIGLKLDRACIDFVNFWEKTGAKALKAASWPTEKAVGYPLGGIDQAIWAAGEFIEAFPGQKRLGKVLEIHDQLERLGKGELTPEKVSELQRLQEFHKYAAKGQWEEIGKFNKWHEQKKDVLSALRTFGGLREKLSRWAQRKQEKAEEKKEKAKGRRIGEVKEKLK